MANGMEGLFIGNTALRTAQNAINTSANNLANVNTDGYVRQQVVFADTGYNFFKSAAVSSQSMGLGVSIGEVVRARDIFLDKTYRSESGRQAYYDSYYNAIDEVQSLYQELDGEAFKEVLTGDSSLWTAFQQLAEDPSDSVAQNLVIQKSSLFLTRANAIYSSMSTYQSEINTQISDDIDKVNDLGSTIYKLNLQIQKIEAGGTETAYDLRDQRDKALDDLSSYANISYSEDSTGIVSVKMEGQLFVDEADCYDIGKEVDQSTGYITPYWPNLSNEANGSYQELFNFEDGVSSENNTDIGELKSLVQARGNSVKNYTSIDGVDAETYASTTGMSVMESSEAQLDQLVHGVVTGINDILCPNTTASFNVTVKNADGTSTTTSYSNVKVLDAENCDTGSDGKLPPNELFSRVGCDRYTQVTGDDGNTYYVYNEEDTDDSKTITIGSNSYRVWDSKQGNGTVTVTNYDAAGNKTGNSVAEPYEQYDTEKNPKYTRQFISGQWYYVANENYSCDTSTQYTLTSTSVNSTLESQVNLFPYKTQSGEVDYKMASNLSDLWNQDGLTLIPGSNASYSFSNYYTEMIGNLATAGSTYESTSTTLYSSVTALDNQRSQVTGVSTDEELTSMIKYQNAYNAASRYIQAVTDMLDVLVSSMT